MTRALVRCAVAVWALVAALFGLVVLLAMVAAFVEGFRSAGVQEARAPFARASSPVPVSRGSRP